MTSFHYKRNDSKYLHKVIMAQCLFSHLQALHDSSICSRVHCLTFACEMTDCVLRRGFRGPALVCGVLILGET